MLTKFESRVHTCESSGKKVPSIISKHLAEMKRVTLILAAQPGNEFASSRMSKLIQYLEDEIGALESKETKNTRAVKVGEDWLSDDALARKANRHAGLVQELARIRADYARRTADLESALSRVADSVPMAQREEYSALYNLFGQSGISLEDAETV